LHPKRAEQRGADGLEFLAAVHVGALHVADGILGEQFVDDLGTTPVPVVFEPAARQFANVLSHCDLLVVGDLPGQSRISSPIGAFV
jgi:hypothetical protein